MTFSMSLNTVFKLLGASTWNNVAFLGTGLFQRVFIRLMCFAFWKVTLKCILLRIPFPKLNKVSRCNANAHHNIPRETKQNPNKSCIKTEQIWCKVFCCPRQIKIAVLFPYQYALFQNFPPCSMQLLPLWGADRCPLADLVWRSKSSDICTVPVPVAAVGEGNVCLCFYCPDQ